MKFRGDHHDDKVRQIMNRELPNIKVPVPRPTRTHMFDFNLTFNSARLLDGECKGTQSQHEKAILIFHSLDQLTFKDNKEATWLHAELLFFCTGFHVVTSTTHGVHMDTTWHPCGNHMVSCGNHIVSTFETMCCPP